MHGDTLGPHVGLVLPLWKCMGTDSCCDRGLLTRVTGGGRPSLVASRSLQGNPGESCGSAVRTSDVKAQFGPSWTLLLFFSSLPPGEYCAVPEFDQQVLVRRPRSKDSKLLQQPALFPPARGGNRWRLVWEEVKQAEVWEGV